MGSLEELRIDPEFEKMIPPLTEEESRQLEANILSEGEVLSPLVVWDGVIVDGHNRYRVIQRHPEINFSVRYKEFTDRYEAITWICTNQLGRRNLSEIQKKMLIGKQYEAEKLMHGGKRKTDRGVDGRFTASPQIDDLRSSMRTAERIAAETNTSKAYVERAGKYIKGVRAAEEALPGIEQEIMAGELKPSARAIEAIARAAPEDRRELAELLRQPRPSPARKRTAPEEDGPSPVEEELFREETADPDEEADSEDEPEVKDTAEKDAVGTLSLPNKAPASGRSAFDISEGMASTPERERREASAEGIIAELTDAMESMIFRWDFCLSTNKANADRKECRQALKALAAKGIQYLKTYQKGGKTRNDTE